MQRLWFNIDGEIQEFSVPESAVEVMPGVQWGEPDELFTPSFWKYQSEAQIRRHRYGHHRLGNSLLEEIAVCLLGGYGIPAEMGMAAFERLRINGALSGSASQEQLLELLTTPFEIDGRTRRYRFATQKASYLARSLSQGVKLTGDMSPRELRDKLMVLPGIGPKTASWIVRNHTDADDVAIIDVHLHRACVLMNVFAHDSDPARDYFLLEDLFLNFAECIKVRASILDAIIWDFMRRIGPTSRSAKIEQQPSQLLLAF